LAPLCGGKIGLLRQTCLLAGVSRCPSFLGHHFWCFEDCPSSQDRGLHGEARARLRHLCRSRCSAPRDGPHPTSANRTPGTTRMSPSRANRARLGLRVITVPSSQFRHHSSAPVSVSFLLGVRRFLAADVVVPGVVWWRVAVPGRVVPGRVVPWVVGRWVAVPGRVVPCAVLPGRVLPRSVGRPFSITHVDRRQSSGSRPPRRVDFGWRNEVDAPSPDQDPPALPVNP